MFGMLDYRAHKLYWLIAKINHLIIFVLSLGLILASFFIGVNFSKSLLWQIIISILALEVIFGIFSIIIKFWIYLTEKFFRFIIDVVPSEGHSAEEAECILQFGDFYNVLEKLNKFPDLWTFSDTDRLMRRLSFVYKVFFGKKHRDRITKQVALLASLKSSGVSVADLNSWDIQKRFSEKNLMVPWYENMLLNDTIRSIIFKYLVLFLLYFFTA